MMTQTEYYQENKTLQELRKKMAKAMQRKEFIKMQDCQRQIDAILNRKERMTVRDLFTEMTVDDKERAALQCNKIPIFADLMQTAAVQMMDILHKLDPSITIDLIAEVEHINKAANRLGKMVPSLGDDEFTDSFAEMCDKINMVVDNIFHTEIQKNKIKRNPDSQN